MVSQDQVLALPEYKLTEQPEESSGIVEWRYPRMYKRDAKGAKREWFAGIINGGIISLYGLVDGAKILSEPYEVETNTSGRTFIEQAALELRSKYQLKNRKEGYRFSLDETPADAKPMLATAWQNLPRSHRFYYPVAIQPKLDGIRCMVKLNYESNKLVYRSRGNVTWNLGYLFDEEISAMLPFFPFNVEFDGELYSHGTSLQTIGSWVRLEKTEDDLKMMKGKAKEKAEIVLKKRRELLKYHIFTIITPKDMPFEDRNDALFQAFQRGQEALGRPFQHITLVNEELASSKEEIEAYLKHYTEDLGYEGIMIYKIGLSLPPDKIQESYYRQNRTTNLVKYKTFWDEEMEILSVKSGKGKAAKLAGCTVKDKFGVTHEVNIAEDDEVRSEILKNPEKVIGKMATVKHYGRTDDGKLRHASIVVIRDYE